MFKLVVNALFAGQVALLAELLWAAEEHGIRTPELAQALRSTPVMSPAAAGAAALMVAGDHASRFPLALALKDLRYAEQLGALPTVRGVREQFERSDAAGRGALNLTAIVPPGVR